MNTLFTLILTCVSLFCFSQEAKLLTNNQEWYDGSILLSDGTELKGLVKYNDRNSVLSYLDGENTKAFSQRSVLGFEFFDESIQRQRVFYTIPYEDSQTGVKRPLYFEVIREYKTFAILSRYEPLETKQKTQTSPSGGLNGMPTYTRTSTLEISQTETIFLMHKDGTIKPYFRIMNIEDGTKNLITQKDTKTKTRMFDEDLLAEYLTRPVYDDLQRYAKENNLKFKRKEDFMKIVAYYDSLRKE